MAKDCAPKRKHPFNEEILTLFDNAKYAQLAYDSRQTYQSNTPFPHIVFDNFLPDQMAHLIALEYPRIDTDSGNFKFHNHKNVSRYLLEDIRKYPLNLRLFASAINSRSFILFLETLTGIKALLPDPYFMGGGAMMSSSGGFLNIHVDFNWHQKMQVWRRCNALFYLTENWKDEYAGKLELWSDDGSVKITEIAPLFNRVVVFNTTSKSYHGQPVPFVAPAGTYRHVFSAFYYTSATSEDIAPLPHFTKYNGSDERQNNVAQRDTSPYSEGITADYLSEVSK